ncbi:ABC transporter substrate-binding protein [Reichenbachiella sp.]|uniref:ABC transporter substrate-binding protein n=1 Tax=Reichenbachiella sp. TaxID=2184521 RepID=UPI003B590168
MNQIKSYILILYGTLLFVSCETPAKVVDSKEPYGKKSIRINFQDNILQLNPLQSNNRSEVFVKELVFEKFMELDFSSHLFETYQFDTLQGRYTFNLNPKKYFHDGSPVDSQAVHDFLKYLIQYQYSNESVQQLFSSMNGFGLVNWYRENRGITDSIPNGFQIINPYSFSINLRSKKEQLLVWFQDPVFTLFKESNGSYIGSGDFELIELNEDISARLIRRSTSLSNIQSIELSFLKNRDLVYSEFLRGQLDLVLFNPYQSPYSTQTKRLNKILTSQYPAYQVTQSNRSVIKYLEIKEVHDSLFLQKIWASIDLKSDSLLTRDVLDSTIHKIQWYSDIENDSNQYFLNTPAIEFVKTIPENINPTDPQIVIKDMEVEFWNKSNEKYSRIQLAKKLKGTENSKFLILESYPEYVIYNNELLGIDSKTKISTIVKKASFKKIKSY